VEGNSRKKGVGRRTKGEGSSCNSWLIDFVAAGGRDMKTTGKCPKCGLGKVAVIPSKLGTYNQIKTDFSSSVDVTRYICTACGYMEQYVASEKALQQLGSRLGPEEKK
jgi:ssDNA-binding Zn-finger/Zn-ribbon topoisomerase 1